MSLTFEPDFFAAASQVIPVLLLSIGVEQYLKPTGKSQDQAVAEAERLSLPPAEWEANLVLVEERWKSIRRYRQFLRWVLSTAVMSGVLAELAALSFLAGNHRDTKAVGWFVLMSIAVNLAALIAPIMKRVWDKALDDQRPA